MNPIDKAIRDAQSSVIAAQGLKIQTLEAEVALLRRLLVEAEAASKVKPVSKVVA